MESFAIARGISRSDSIDSICLALADGLARPDAALARVWVADADGLKLRGSAGTPVGGGSYTRCDGAFARISRAVGKIGQIAATGDALVVGLLRGDEEWLVNPGWIARQNVRAFAGFPITSGSEVFGVLAVFDRTPPSDARLDALAFLANHAAHRLAELRDRVELETRLHAREVDLAALRDATGPPPSPEIHGAPAATTRVITRADLRAYEKQAIEVALQQTHGRVFGPKGAALLLGMKPTTLASRIKALGLR